MIGLGTRRAKKALGLRRVGQAPLSICTDLPRQHFPEIESGIVCEKVFDHYDYTIPSTLRSCSMTRLLPRVDDDLHSGKIVRKVAAHLSPNVGTGARS